MDWSDPFKVFGFMLLLGVAFAVACISIALIHHNKQDRRYRMDHTDLEELDHDDSLEEQETEADRGE